LVELARRPRADFTFTVKSRCPRPLVFLLGILAISVAFKRKTAPRCAGLFVT
jgi:hypothetical protein